MSGDDGFKVEDVVFLCLGFGSLGKECLVAVVALTGLDEPGEHGTVGVRLDLGALAHKLKLSHDLGAVFQRADVLSHVGISHVPRGKRLVGAALGALSAHLGHRELGLVFAPELEFGGSEDGGLLGESLGHEGGGVVNVDDQLTGGRVHGKFLSADYAALLLSVAAHLILGGCLLFSLFLVPV